MTASNDLKVPIQVSSSQTAHFSQKNLIAKLETMIFKRNMNICKTKSVGFSSSPVGLFLNFRDIGMRTLLPKHSISYFLALKFCHQLKVIIKMFVHLIFIDPAIV